MNDAMNWIKESLKLFQIERPAHFTNYTHCHECYDVDSMLQGETIESIGIKKLGTGCEALIYCTTDGIQYFTPALIRLSLETIHTDFYFGDFSYYLQSNGNNNSYYLSCTSEQRRFIARFILYMMEQYATEIENNGYDDDVLNAYGVWASA